MRVYSRADFQLESIPIRRFAGYTDASDWNGFERPLFEYETAEEILRLSEANGFQWKYDLQHDEFIVAKTFNGGEDEEIFTGVDVEVSGDTVHLYPIGAGSWIWSQAESD